VKATLRVAFFMRELLNLPETLQQEREGISAGLASLNE
jgi:hypothetical protein